jgi:hypothetical protein
MHPTANQRAPNRELARARRLVAAGDWRRKASQEKKERTSPKGAEVVLFFALTAPSSGFSNELVSVIAPL